MDKIVVGIKLGSDDACTPVYKTVRSSGADVYSVDPDYTLMPGESRLFHTGIYLQIPDGYEIQVRSRSGLAAKHGVVVLNSPGTIDSDYQGECNVILANHGPEPFCVVKGERIAQFVLAPVAQAVFQGILDFTEETDRGAGGFGSTGMK